MSFAVLGCVVPGIVILDKECVNKTYPEFWTDLEKYFGVKLHTPPELDTSDESKGKRNFIPSLSLFLPFSFSSSM